MQADKIGGAKIPGSKEEIEAMTAALSPEQREKVQAILKDEDRLRALLSSPAAARLMEQLGGKK